VSSSIFFFAKYTTIQERYFHPTISLLYGLRRRHTPDMSIQFRGA